MQRLAYGAHGIRGHRATRHKILALGPHTAHTAQLASFPQCQSEYAPCICMYCFPVTAAIVQECRVWRWALR